MCHAQKVGHKTQKRWVEEMSNDKGWEICYGTETHSFWYTYLLVNN